MDDEATPVRSPAVLPKVDGLPDTEREITIVDRDVFGRSREDRSRVGGHVVGSLVVVLPVHRFGSELGEPPVQIAEHGGIGVLLDHQTGRRVLHEHGAHSCRHAARANQRSHPLGDIDGPRAWRCNVDLILVDTHTCDPVVEGVPHPRYLAWSARARVRRTPALVASFAFRAIGTRYAGVSDLLVPLLRLPPLDAYLAPLRARGITVRPARAYEKSATRRFVLRHFSQGWADEADVAFARTPVGCYLATHESKVIGFAVIESTAKAYFGPTGVSPGYRGLGVGAALLVAAMVGLYER